MIECFFFIEQDDNEGVVRALCLKCRQQLPKNFPAWFYSGQVGPWTVKCNKCDQIIFLYENKESDL